MSKIGVKYLQKWLLHGPSNHWDVSSPASCYMKLQIMINIVNSNLYACNIVMYMYEIMLFYFFIYMHIHRTTYICIYIYTFVICIQYRYMHYLHPLL